MSRMPKMSAWVRRVSGYAGITGPRAASAPTTTTAQRARRRITRRCSPRSSAPAEEPGGPDGEDQGHRSEQREVGQLGKERLAEVVEEPDEKAARHGARQAAEPAHDDDDEGVREHLEVGARIDAEEAGADDPAEGGQPGAETEDGERDTRHVDAPALRHLAVVHGGADHGADPRPVQQEPEPDADGDGDAHDEDAVDGEHGAAQPQRA